LQFNSRICLKIHIYSEQFVLFSHVVRFHKQRHSPSPSQPAFRFADGFLPKGLRSISASSSTAHSMNEMHSGNCCFAPLRKGKTVELCLFPPSAIEIPLPAPPPLVVGCGWVIHCASVKQIWIIFQSDDIERSVGSSLAVGWEPPAFLRLQKSPPFPNSVFLCWSGGRWHTPACWMTDPLWRTLLSCPGGSVGGGGQPAPIRPSPQGRRSHGGHNHDRSLMVPTSAPIPGRVRGGGGVTGGGGTKVFSPSPWITKDRSVDAHRRDAGGGGRPPRPPPARSPPLFSSWDTLYGKCRSCIGES